MDNTISHHLKHRLKAHIGGNMGNKPKIDTNTPSIHKSLVLSHFWANMGKIRGGNLRKEDIWVLFNRFKEDTNILFKEDKWVFLYLFKADKCVLL